MRLYFLIALLIFSITAFSQKKFAFVQGKVIDENENTIPNVSVIILGKTTGVVTNDSGFFIIKVPAEKAIALLFTHTGYNESQMNFLLNEKEKEIVTIRLEKGRKTLETVVVTDERERKEAGLTKINPKDAIVLPSTVGGVEGMIKTLVGSNNELTSNYNVRGGNYDENLIYINDFEIYRPYLVSSGQQEGLSFINPEMAKNVSFYNGGYQCKYGDKMSSVLDIQYRKPKEFAGSVYISPLEQGFHLENISRNNRLTFIMGVRNKTNKNLLSSQETTGTYAPSSSDVQAYITYKVSEKWQLELLGNLSTTKFNFIPQSAQKTSSVFSPFFTENLGLDIYFNGQEKDAYSTNFIGFSAINQPNSKIKIKWMLSHYQDIENENFDIGANYLFGERNFDNGSSTFGQIINPLGSGYYQNYGRNSLNIQIYNASVKASIEEKNHFIQFGSSVEQAIIHDKLYEWEFQDSAEYSLPLNSGNLSSFLNNSVNLSYQKYTGFVQDNMNFKNENRDISLQYGLRYNYNSLNHEFFVSPRAQVSIKPNWEKDVVFKFAAGSYNQPPFYRELRGYNGLINPNVLSQKSLQAVAGVDYNFKNSARPFRLTTEAYYKNIKDLNPYDIDNVKIQYFGNNNAKGYAYGVESRLYGELIKDAESWFSIGLMRTREKIDNDYYYDYKNAAGQIITGSSTDKVPVDSVRNQLGWVRRPSDRLLTLGLFLQDYLSTNKNFKVHLNLIYGSNMPFNIPNSVKFRNALIIDPYIRADIGFSALLLSEKSKRRSHSPFKEFENIWASLEVFNLINRANVISYQLIKDFSNSTYAIPNTLTPRLINFKIVGRF